MSGDAPVTDATPAADAAPADLLETPAADAAAPDAATLNPEGDKPATESKPDGDKPSGEDGKGEGDKADADLLADDDEGKSPEGKDGQADKPKDGAPETYEAFTTPDGVQLDETAIAQATPIFKELNLDQSGAQKLVDVYATLQQAAAQQQVDGFNQVKKDWQAEIKADPEFGGDKLPETLGAAKAVLGKFGDKALLNDMKEWGWANHPGLIRLLARVKAHLSEDTLVTGDEAAQQRPKSAAQTIYPNMPGDNQ